MASTTMMASSTSNPDCQNELAHGQGINRKSEGNEETEGPQYGHGDGQYGNQGQRKLCKKRKTTRATRPNAWSRGQQYFMDGNLMIVT